MRNDNNKIILKACMFDDRKIAYSSRTKFEVQIGKNKSAYKTVATFEGSLHRAAMHYQMLNIHSGYKKRLLSYDLNKPLLARYIS